MKTRMLEHEIKEALLRYHKERGYEIFDSSPLVSKDPTVLFVNAAITPFKPWFIGGKAKNYALIQTCLRMGGAIDLSSVGANSYYQTVFDMFGSGTFNVKHAEAVAYLLDLVMVFGLEKDHLCFTVPDEITFRESLVSNGIDEARIFTLRENGTFWQRWEFGKLGPIGQGLTLIYARREQSPTSVRQMEDDPDGFVDLLNLIHVFGQEGPDGNILPAGNPGFDLGMGIGRLAAIVQETHNYGIDSVKPLMETATRFFHDQGHLIDETVQRILVDHLKAICVLVREGLEPSNKRHGYVLRKLVRRYLEFAWVSAGSFITTGRLVEEFCKGLPYNQPRFAESVNNLIQAENNAVAETIRKARLALQRNPDLSATTLWETYGLSPSVSNLLQGKENLS